MARQSVTLSAGLNLIHALFRGPGTTLFGSTRTSPANLVKWADYKDLSAYTSLSYSGETAGTANSADSAVYDPATGFVYQCFTAYLNNDGFFHCKVSRVDPAAMTYTILVDDPIDDTFSPGTPAIETDGTYLYMGTGSNNAAAVRRYDLSTGAFVDQVVISAKRIHTIQKDSAYIYVGGPTTAASSGPPWAARVPKTMASYVGINVSGAADRLVTDDSVLLGGYYWLGTESGGHGVVKRVAQDMGSYADVNVGVDADSFGLFTDGTFVYAAMKTTPGTIVRVNPTTLAAVEAWPLLPGEDWPNELVFFPETGEYVTCCFLSPAIVVRDLVPAFPGPPALTAMSVSGALR